MFVHHSPALLHRLWHGSSSTLPREGNPCLTGIAGDGLPSCIVPTDIFIIFNDVYVCMPRHQAHTTLWAGVTNNCELPWWVLGMCWAFMNGFCFPRVFPLFCCHDSGFSPLFCQYSKLQTFCSWCHIQPTFLDLLSRNHYWTYLDLGVFFHNDF